nr:long-chain fatty acid--CoA ligase [Salsuginibacillus kocurii]
MTYEERSLHSYLKESAENYPDKQALHFMGTTMSYKTVYSYSLKVANQLQAEGIQKGDRVALMLANSPQSVICYYGALLAGAIVVQTNPLYVEREVEHQLMDSGAKIMICLDLVFPRVDAVRQNTQLEKVIVTSIKDFLPFPKNILYPLVQKKNSGIKVDVSYDSQTVHFKTWLEQGSEKEPEVAVNPKEDLALLQYTGGTTGPAKGVMLTHYNLVVNTLQSRAWMYKMEKGNERILAVLPFFHVYGMTAAMNIAIMYASSLIILPKFEPKQVLKTIQKQKVTLFPGAPTMYIGLIHDPDIDKYDLSSIKACLSGSAPLPKEVQDTFEKITGGKLVEGYGLTETSPVAAANPIWAKSKTGSIGIPWPDTEMAIYSSEGEGFAPAGEIGEIVIKGPQVMQGYWNRPEETQATLKDGWFFSGDMGYMDEDGFFYIVDRKKDMIIAGGFNIYPREIEEVLYEHESIQEAAVIGVPDPYRGETVKAFIVLKDGAATTEKEIEDFCRKQLAAFKVPKQVEFREELPKTMVGKVLRRVLVEEEEAKAFANAQEKEGS